MKTPSSVDSVDSLELVSTCVDITQSEWGDYMEGTTKADGLKIRRLIKEHRFELYETLGLQFWNHYETGCVKKRVLLVYVHSGIEYFFKYT